MRKYEAMTNQFEHLTEAELTELDLSLATAHGNHSWDSFYEDRAKLCTFFGTAPDESLSGWVHDGLLRPGRAVELGCGNGRNAIFLARQGFSVAKGVKPAPCDETGTQGSAFLVPLM
jgi:Tellurite resistance protein TehB